MDATDPRFGRVVIAYPDPTSIGWGGVIGGGVTLAIGLFPVVAVLAGDASLGSEVNGDMIAGLLCIGSWNLIGLAILVGGVRDVRGKPEWRLCEQGAVWIVRGAVRDAVLYRDVPAPTIVEVQRRGTTVGHRVQLGQKVVPVPTREVAERLVGLWRAARGAAA
ncbi:hypothetical protein [Sandaracinus amylolyticus]|uniref:hypothetical protein n=1 Tax=Sandaracinus amylolyticus TaxID=927083 RepID=UPI001F248FC5|nr:hypothetical protein [Sandaracinus amylolyticus]UJR80759.1 Hypothetical protein I5071_28090 [Sandaracinus amylolyticus]